MSRPAFASLKLQYPTGAVHDCTMLFPNTCAIRMSEALAGVDAGWIDVFRKSGLNTCTHGYMRGAQDLASVLRRSWGSHDKGFTAQATRDSVPESMETVRGVVCFMEIPTFSGQGHIDLWRDGAIATDGKQYWDAETIWFWEL